MIIIQGHRLDPLFLLALSTGLRRGELAALTWDCIDFDKREITVKGSVNRIKGPDISYVLATLRRKADSIWRACPLKSTYTLCYGVLYSVIQFSETLQNVERIYIHADMHTFRSAFG